MDDADVQPAHDSNSVHSDRCQAVLFVQIPVNAVQVFSAQYLVGLKNRIFVIRWYHNTLHFEELNA